jgi:hypothetical protein
VRGRRLQQRLRYGRGRKRDPVQIVASLEHEHRSAARRARGARQAQAGERPETALREPHARQRVVPVRVEAHGHEQQLGIEAAADREHDLAVDARIFRVVQARRHRKVDGEPAARPLPHIVEAPRTGIERELVGRDVQHARIAPEAVLGAVAVVDVPVDDRHALEPARQGVLGPDRHVVEQAEAHRPVPLRVMARRPHGAEGALDAAVQDTFDRVHDRTRSQQRRFVRTGTCLRVRVERDRASARRSDAFQVPLAMDPEQLLRRGRLRLERDEPFLEPRLAQPAPHGPEPLGPLRVPVAGVVLAEDRMVVQRDAHRAVRPPTRQPGLSPRDSSRGVRHDTRQGRHNYPRG